MRRTGVLSINEALNQDDMVNLISQNVINNMQAALQAEDDLPNLTTAPGDDTESTNPVILHLADQINKLAQQLVLLQQQRQQTWVPTNQPPMGFQGWQQVPYTHVGKLVDHSLTSSWHLAR